MQKQLLFRWAFCLLTLLPFFDANAQGRIVISQVYGGGGNSGATFTNDFIELFNTTNQPVDVSGWSVQYASTAGTSWQRTNLTGTIQPGRYYLVQQAAGTGGTTALPTPDATGTIAMSGTGGKVALVSNQINLTGSCPTENVIDFVGFGATANCFEGAPTPNLSNTTAALRAGNGCTDTGNNSLDFSTGMPAPRNSSTMANPCGSMGERTNPAATASANPAAVAPGAQTRFTVTVTPGANPPSTGISVTGDFSPIGGPAAQPLFNDGTNGDITAGDNVFSSHATITEATSPGSKTIGFSVADAEGRTATASADLQVTAATAITAIYTIQGSSNTSPLLGQTVTTQGVVVGDYQGTGQLNGFFIQDATGDDNPATSDGIFVSSTTPVSVGQIVRVTGTVREAFTQTQIGGNTGDNINVAVQPGTAAVIPAQVILPVSSTGVLEQFEGMLVTFPQVLTVSQNFTLARFGEIWLSADLDYPFSEVDGRLYNPTNFMDPTDNPAAGTANATDNKAAVATQQELHKRSSILLDDASSVQNPATVPYLGPGNTLRVGSSVSNLTGVLNYSFNTYRLQPTQAPAFTYAPRPLDPPATGNANLKIASFNVLNYFNGNGAGGGFPTPRGATNLFEFNRQRAKIIAALKALDADVVGLIELENDGDGVASAIADLVNGLNEATSAGRYDYIRDAASGGTGTDAIKVAFIYKPGTVTPVGIPIADLASIHNRPPLAQTFKLNSNGEIVTPVINHFKSKSGTGSGLNADQQDGQGNFNFDRVKQAEALVNFINNTVIPAAGDQDVIILGDLNAYFEEDPIDVLRTAGFISLFGPESYSYVFDGQSGSLDHALVTPNLKKQFARGGKWHINADEPIFLDYNTEFKTAAQISDLYSPDPFRSSDHDPVLVGLRLATPTIGFAQSGATVKEDAGTLNVAFTLSEPVTEDTEVVLEIASQGAEYGSDYTTSPDAADNAIAFTIPANSITASFLIQVADDQSNELEEKVSFTVKNAGSILTVSEPASFVLTILDNDVPVVTFKERAAARAEGSGEYSVLVNASVAPVQDLPVKITILEGVNVTYGSSRDYVTSPDGFSRTLTVTIPAGQLSGSFTVKPIVDNVKEKDPETIVFSLTPVPAQAAYQIGRGRQFTFSITDAKAEKGKTAIAFTIWPNPTSGPISLGFSSGESSLQTITVSLRSDSGEEIYSGTGTLDQISRTISEKLKSRLPGFYLIQVSAGDESQLIRVLKQ